MATNNVITLPTTNNTTIIKEAPSMKNVQIENERFINNGLYANYDAKKVAKVLEAVDNSERRAWYETQGVTLDNVTSLDVALKLSGLDFEVEKKPVYFNSTFGMTNEAGKNLPPKFTKIEGQFTTVRTDTMQPFGVVTDAYEILQNRDAFDFLDSLVVEGAKFETAGFFKKNGAASYITMSTEPMTILGDKFDPFMMISNGHDGGSAVKVCLTAIRAVCRNTAILALKKASNLVTVQHSKKMYDKLLVAQEVLLSNTKYMEELKIVAEELAVKPFSEEAFEALVRKLYPIEKEQSEIIQIRNLAQIEHLFRAYKQDDLQNFNGTAWKCIQAFSDAESHALRFRKSNKIANNGTPEFQVVYNGMPLLNKVFAMLQEAV